MRNEEIVLLVVLGIGVLFFFWLRLGGSKDAEEEANRIDQKASYLQYKLSLWYRTEKNQTLLSLLEL